VILFTSGSEKDPKAVQLTHKNLGANIKALREVFSLTEEDVFMSVLPLFSCFWFQCQSLDALDGRL